MDKAAISQYLELVEKTKGKGLESLANHITMDPRIFQFQEFIDSKNYVNENYDKKYLELLKLFAYKNYQFYIKNKDNYPVLDAQQIVKLKQLSLVELCSQQKILSYDLIKNELQIEDEYELDQFIIQCIYSDLISGKINQEQRIFRVNRTISRDIQTQDIQFIKNKLQKILDENNVIKKNIQNKIEYLNNSKQKNIEHRQNIDEQRSLHKIAGINKEK